ncbi:MAG: IS1380 family transposase [Tepidisphaeraceae bacterium]|jgi:DDE family transposase
MTDCNTNGLVFTPQGRRAVIADFGGGAITSDAGALLLREVDRRLGLTERIDQVVPDPRDPLRIAHTQLTLLRQRIYGIALGYEDGNDHQTLRDDPVMQLIARPKDTFGAVDRGIDPDRPLASPPTLCRLENRVNRQTNMAIAEELVEAFIRSFKQPPKELILDFDATDDEVHGNQVGRFFHGYYDHYCFLPLYVFCGTQLLAAYLRPSNIDASKHSRAILKLLVERFRQAWPQVKILFRADSGFCRWRLLRWCDRHQVDYLVGIAKNSRLLELAEPLMQEAQRRFEATGQDQRLFTETDYAAQTWDRSRRTIIKAEHNSQGPNPRFVVTSLQGQAQSLYDTIYCARGECENRIKEQQLGLFADRTSCHDFDANQFRVLLSAAAYVLVETLRREHLIGTALQEAQMPTIRLKLLKIGARVVASVRRIVLHLASGYPLQNLLRDLVTRLSSPMPNLSG